MCVLFNVNSLLSNRINNVCPVQRKLIVVAADLQTHLVHTNLTEMTYPCPSLTRYELDCYDTIDPTPTLTHATREMKNT